jgi:nitroimidazol reductase NimA-like FMN-containing flavoprotein (pyridoxamine 5'-phosphate oxidase superfamily)
MDYSEIVALINTDPFVQELLAAPIPMRLGYVGLDGHPRTIPLAYLWDGKDFVFASPSKGYKIKAIAAHPEVSFTVDTNGFPPLIMMVRGKASIEVRDSLPEEFVEAARRIVGPEKMPEWERGVRANPNDMSVITVVPTSISVCDFVTRFPPFVSAD